MKARGYQMTARAASTARTAEAILAATIELFEDKPVADITLADIAARAGVTVQTVLRRFGDKDGVFDAAIEQFASEVFGQRGAAVGLGAREAITNLAAHYEQWGALMLKMLAEEPRTPGLRTTLDAGRTYHRNWCRDVFADALAGLPAARRSRRLAQICCICDLRTWENLRLTAGLSRAQTELAVYEMLRPLITKEP
ncbi:helix-turn-helix domain-containing protein [uncultured Mycolicibacterium sp.]|uniref:TetR/AcrR family transcriptional regulator n=1 Tax=uncultured Mycolicibacterium sp. TaxID=2320817 RepID=UPI0032B2C587